MQQTPFLSPLSALRESSGDAAADNRFAWGQAAAQEQDHVAACELFEQVLERTPQWAPAWFALAQAREATGDIAAAVAAYGEALAHDATGRLGADLRLAALGAGSAPARPSNAYVSQLFDQYAPRFEAHLVGTLRYRGPELMLAALDAVTARHFDHGIDLGCGTGLAARLLSHRATRFTGVDLSPAMVAAAQASGLYRRVVTGEAADFLVAEPPASADLVLAADVLVYIGDLAPLFGAAARVMQRGGLFIATAQTSAEPGWSLGKDLRYAHSPAYVTAVAGASGLQVERLEEAWARREHGDGVPGLVIVLSKA